MRILRPALILSPLLLGGCVYIDTTTPEPPTPVYYYPMPPPPLPPSAPAVRDGRPAVPGEPIPLPPPR